MKLSDRTTDSPRSRSPSIVMPPSESTRSGSQAAAAEAAVGLDVGGEAHRRRVGCLVGVHQPGPSLDHDHDGAARLAGDVEAHRRAVGGTHPLPDHEPHGECAPVEGVVGDRARQVAGPAGRGGRMSCSCIHESKARIRRNSRYGACPAGVHPSSSNRSRGRPRSSAIRSARSWSKAASTSAPVHGRSDSIHISFMAPTGFLTWATPDTSMSGASSPRISFVWSRRCG